MTYVPSAEEHSRNIREEFTQNEADSTLIVNNLEFIPKIGRDPQNRAMSGYMVMLDQSNITCAIN